MSNEKQLNLITVGYAKRALESDTRERLRMRKYASVMNELHVIVFTHLPESFPAVQRDGNLFLYAAAAKTRPGMLYAAYKIGREIIKNSDGKNWVVSSQDPFETSLVSRAIAFSNRATNHVQLHGDVFNSRSYRSSFLQHLRAIYGRYVVRNTSCIRVVSERLKKSLESLGVPSRSIVVLPIQANLADFIEVGKNRVYDVSKPLSFLYVGRFAVEKNISLIINSFASVAGEFPNVTLTLLGSGPLQSKLEAQIVSLGLANRINFQSWTDNVADIMSQHDILCLSSNHEGWGMVLLEAAATGMPVVTTDVGCAGELIRDFETGLVISVGDEVGYIDALKKYLTEPQLVSKHGRCGYEIATTVSMPETLYLKKLVESYTSCGAEKPDILAGNGKT